MMLKLYSYSRWHNEEKEIFLRLNPELASKRLQELLDKELVQKNKVQPRSK